MSKLAQKILFIIYKQFNIFWIVLSAIFLLIASLVNWHLGLQKAYDALSSTAIILSNNFDQFIEDVLQEVYTLPVDQINLSTCSPAFYHNLERIILNNPQMSGLALSYKKKSICSTVPGHYNFISPIPAARGILGPFTIPLFDQPVYVIQQKIGNYQVGVLILASVIAKVLNPHDQQIPVVLLYDSNKKKNIVLMKYNHYSGWVLNNISSAIPPMPFAYDLIHSIDGLTVTVYKSSSQLLQPVWYRIILSNLIILFISAILYWLTKSLISQRYSLSGAIKLGIKNKEFYPSYQPLFDQNTKKYCGVEVLLRWIGSNDKVIMPDFFIEEAESSGLIVPITLQIIETTFIQTRDILTTNPDFHLGINLSALHFLDTLFLSQLNQLMTQYTIDPKQIILEITERSLLDKNNGIFIQKMQELRQAGFSLAVDDYGTGHASISYLQHFPFNYLKIDKVFIQAIGTHAITESLNHAIITMAKRLNLIIIAEGVETAEQVNYLAEHEVRLLQGWYFSKALSIEQLIHLLKEEYDESLR